ncbi:MAG: hypothetical protein U9P07_02340, partial [Pseudomonadota bacterium]|nr:hypothetical protein [Pseudomonadota bacterium]
TLNKVAGFNFHNRSQYDFAKLIADPDNIAANLRNFINGFSAGVPEILEHFTPREVKPHVPDAWIDEIKIKTGYEISFTKYFYEFNPLRPLAEIKADILKLEEETVELEKKVLA